MLAARLSGLQAEADGSTREPIRFARVEHWDAAMVVGRVFVDVAALAVRDAGIAHTQAADFGFRTLVRRRVAAYVVFACFGFGVGGAVEAGAVVADVFVVGEVGEVVAVIVALTGGALFGDGVAASELGGVAVCVFVAEADFTGGVAHGSRVVAGFLHAWETLDIVQCGCVAYG